MGSLLDTVAAGIEAQPGSLLDTVAAGIEAQPGSLLDTVAGGIRDQETTAARPSTPTYSSWEHARYGAQFGPVDGPKMVEIATRYGGMGLPRDDIRSQTRMAEAREEYEQAVAARPEAHRLPLGSPWPLLQTGAAALTGTIWREDPFILRSKYEQPLPDGSVIAPELIDQYVAEDKAAIRKGLKAKAPEVLRTLQTFVPDLLKAVVELASRKPYEAADGVTDKSLDEFGVRDLAYVHTPSRSVEEALFKDRLAQDPSERQRAYDRGEGAFPDLRPTKYADVDNWVTRDDNGNLRVDANVMRAAKPDVDPESPEGIRYLRGMMETWVARKAAIDASGADESTPMLLLRGLAEHVNENIINDPGKYLLFSGIEPAFDVMCAGDLVMGVSRWGVRGLKAGASRAAATAERAREASLAAADVKGLIKTGPAADAATARVKKLEGWAKTLDGVTFNINPVKAVADTLWTRTEAAAKKAMAEGNHEVALAKKAAIDDFRTQVEDSLKRMDLEGLTTIRADADYLLRAHGQKFVGQIVLPVVTRIVKAVEEGIGITAKPRAGLLGRLGLKDRSVFDAESMRATSAALTSIGKELGPEGSAIAGRAGYGITREELAQSILKDVVPKGDDLTSMMGRLLTDKLRRPVEEIYEAVRESVPANFAKAMDDQMKAAVRLDETIRSGDILKQIRLGQRPQFWEDLGYGQVDAGKMSARYSAEAAKYEAAKAKYETLEARIPDASMEAASAGDVNVSRAKARADEAAYRADAALSIRHGKALEAEAKARATAETAKARAEMVERRAVEKAQSLNASFEASRTKGGMGAILDEYLREEFRAARKPAAVWEEAGIDEAAKGLVEGVARTQTGDVVFREASPSLRLDKIGQQLVRDKMRLSGVAGAESPVEWIELYRRLRQRDLARVMEKGGELIVPTDIAADAMLYAPNSPLGKAAIAASNAGFAKLKPGPSLMRMQPKRLLDAVDKGMAEAAKVSGKAYIPNVIQRAHLANAYLDLIELPRQFITERFDDLLRLGVVSPELVANLDKYLPETGLKYADNELQALNEWYGLGHSFGANVDRLKQNRGVSHALGMVENLVLRQHRAAMDMSQMAATHQYAALTRDLLTEKGKLLTGRMVDDAIDSYGVRRGRFRAVVMGDDGVPIERDLIRLNRNDVNGTISRATGAEREARAHLQSEETAHFFDPETLEYKQLFPDDKKKFGALAGTLVESRTADFIKMGDPLLVKEQSDRILASMVGRSIRGASQEAGGLFKGAHVAGSPKSALRNFANNTLWSLAAPWGRSVFRKETVNNIPRWTREFFEGSAGADNPLVQAENAGMFDASFLGAEGIETKKSLGTAWNDLQRASRVYDKAIEKPVGAFGRAMTPVRMAWKANKLYVKEASSLYNFVEVWNKILNKIAVEREIGLFREAEGSIMDATRGRVPLSSVRDVMVRGLDSTAWTDVLKNYADATGMTMKNAQADLGLKVKASKLVDSYRWFERPPMEEVAAGVAKAVANPNREAWNLADKIGFNYHKVNGVTRALRGGIGGAMFSPFITWTSKAAKLGLQLMGAHPAETALLYHLADVSDSVWELSLSPDRLEILAKMAASLNSAQMDQAVLQDVVRMEDVEGRPEGAEVFSMRGLNPLDLLAVSPTKAGVYAFEGALSWMPDAFRSGWLARPASMLVQGYDPLTKRPADVDDALAAIPEVVMSPLFVKPMKTLAYEFLNKPETVSGLRRDPNLWTTLDDQVGIFTERVFPIAESRERAITNAKSLLSAEQLAIVKRYQDIKFMTRNQPNGPTEEEQAALDRLRAAYDDVGGWKARFESLINPGAQ